MPDTNNFGIEIMGVNPETAQKFIDAVNRNKKQFGFLDDDRAIVKPITEVLADLVDNYMADDLLPAGKTGDLAVTPVLVNENDKSFEPLPDFYLRQIQSQMASKDNRYTTEDIFGLASAVDALDLDSDEVKSQSIAYSESQAQKATNQPINSGSQNVKPAGGSVEVTFPDSENAPESQAPTSTAHPQSTVPDSTVADDSEAIAASEAKSTNDALAAIFGSGLPPVADSTTPDTQSTAPVASSTAPVVSAPIATAPDTEPAAKTVVSQEVPATIEATDNEWVERAKKIIDDNNLMAKLPEFDLTTTKVLQPKITKLAQERSQKYSDLVYRIAQELKNRYDEEAEAAERKIEQTQQPQHENELSVLETKRKTDLERDTQAQEANYDKQREEYVQSQIPELRRQFDDQHKTAHEQQLRDLQAQIDKSFEDQKNSISDKWDKYKTEAISNYAEAKLKDFDVKPFIEEYVEFCHQQDEELTHLADEVAQKAEAEDSEAVKRANELREQVKNLEAKLDTVRTAQQSQIDAQVATYKAHSEGQTNDRVFQYQQQINDLSKQLDEAQKKASEFEAQNTKLVNDLVDGRKQLAPAVQQPQQVAQLPATGDTRIERQAPKGSFVKWTIGTAAGVAVLALLGGIYYNSTSAKPATMQNSSMQMSSSQQSSSAQSESSDSSSSQTIDPVKQADGKTVNVVRTGKDGDNYTGYVQGDPNKTKVIYSDSSK